MHRDVLRQVASDLAQMADELQATLSAAGAEASRDNQYWTSEDETTCDPDMTPGALAGDGDSSLGFLPGGSPAGRGQQRDRSWLAWLGEDDHFWGIDAPAVPPVIGG